MCSSGFSCCRWFVYAVISWCESAFTDSYTSFVPLADEAAHQKECIERDDRRNSHIPEQFAGLLHGSSPACEAPDNPYQLQLQQVRKYSGPEPPSGMEFSQSSRVLRPPVPRTSSDVTCPGRPRKNPNRRYSTDDFSHPGSTGPVNSHRIRQQGHQGAL